MAGQAPSYDIINPEALRRFGRLTAGKLRIDMLQG
jgi:hypothetical protein